MISEGILKNPKVHLEPYGPHFAIITDSHVSPLYGAELQENLSQAGFDAHLFTFPAGEASKTRAIKEQLEDQMVEKKLGRDTCLIALGGGVATDLGGFLASTYCRGIPLVMIPTSLLGMVDASIGGKNGVNAGRAKNRIGTIYPPKQVLIDLDTLKTLPLKEVKNGVVEMIKHGLILDSSYFEFLEKHLEEILALNGVYLKPAIQESCRIKLTVVHEDPYEEGKRRILNFGHTIGHALEGASDYRLSHGEAVAAGILAESHLAMNLGFLEESTFQRIEGMIRRVFASFQLPQNVMDYLVFDKKGRSGQPRFAMIDKIGSSMPFDSAYCTTVDETLILEWMQYALYRN
jgi:3-dehydroquinate synthase